MTRLLDAAMQKVSPLPAQEQDRIAQLVLDELDGEARWQQTFARSQDKLARLADDAREQIRRGEVWCIEKNRGAERNPSRPHEAIFDRG